MIILSIEYSDIEGFKNVVEILAILLGGYILMFIFLDLHPKMELNISSHWIDKKNGVLLVEINIRNISKVRCDKEKVSIQCLEYACDFKNELSEWIPFSEKDILKDEPPVSWKPSKEILTTTEFWYPNDCVKVERCYKLPKGSIYKLGLQLVANISLIGRISKVLRKGRWKKQEQWTTTKIIYNC